MENFYVLGVIDPISNHKLYLNRYHYKEFHYGKAVHDKEKDKFILFDEWYYDDNITVEKFSSKYTLEEFLLNKELNIPKRGELKIFKIEGDPRELVTNWKVLSCEDQIRYLGLYIDNREFKFIFNKNVYNTLNNSDKDLCFISKIQAKEYLDGIIEREDGYHFLLKWDSELTIIEDNIEMKLIDYVSTKVNKTIDNWICLKLFIICSLIKK